MGECSSIWQKSSYSLRISWASNPPDKKLEIRYMDFWKVVNGKIIDNWVMVDFPHVAAQLGHDLFNGEGWEAYDVCRKPSTTRKLRKQLFPFLQKNQNHL